LQTPPPAGPVFCAMAASPLWDRQFVRGMEVLRRRPSSGLSQSHSEAIFRVTTRDPARIFSALPLVVHCWNSIDQTGSAEVSRDQFNKWLDRPVQRITAEFLDFAQMHNNGDGSQAIVEAIRDSFDFVMTMMSESFSKFFGDKVPGKRIHFGDFVVFILTGDLAPPEVSMAEIWQWALVPRAQVSTTTPVSPSKRPADEPAGDCLQRIEALLSHIGQQAEFVTDTKVCTRLMAGIDIAESLLSNLPKGPPPSPGLVDRPAPTFRTTGWYPDGSDGSVELGNMLGRVVVLVFLLDTGDALEAGWAPLVEGVQATGGVVLGTVADCAAEQGKEKSSSLGAPVLLDESGAIASAYGVSGDGRACQSAVIIDKLGVVRHQVWSALSVRCDYAAVLELSRVVAGGP